MRAGRGGRDTIAMALIRERRTVGMGEGEKTKGRREWRSGISRAKSQAKPSQDSSSHSHSDKQYSKSGPISSSQSEPRSRLGRWLLSDNEAEGGQQLSIVVHSNLDKRR
eukprot:scaffold4398_cov250-Skeletonema_menzelii.AAC.2